MVQFNTIQQLHSSFHDEGLPHIVERLAKYNYPLELAFRKQKYKFRKEDSELIGRLTQLVELDIPQEIDNPLLLTNLTNLESTPTFPPAIARHFTKCKNLVIRSIKDAKEMDLHRFSNIESLTWAFPLREQPTADPLTMCPHKNSVTNLQIKFVPRDTIDEANLAHYPNLKRLDLIDYEFKSFNKVANLPHLPYLETLCTNFDPIGSLAPLSKTLTSLTITCQNFARQGLAELRRLRYLHITIGEDITELNSFEFLTALTNLESYRFSSKGLKTWGEELQYITSHKLTSFSQFGFTSNYQIEHLTKFGNLLSLVLDKVDLTPESAEVLCKLRTLTSLRFRKMKTDLLPKIETLTNLKTLALTLENATVLAPTELLWIEKLKALEEFSFSSTYNECYRRIDDDRIRSLPLKSITINWPVGEKFLENLCAIKTLEAIELQQAHVSDSSIAHLATLPTLSRLKFAGEVTVLALTALTSLQVLAIRSAKQPALDQTLLQSMPKLWSLRFMTD